MNTSIVTVSVNTGKNIRNWTFPGVMAGAAGVRVIFFPKLVPGSGNFQLSRLAGLG